MRRPHFIARQARNASGLLGRIIAAIMARETWRENQRAISAIDIGALDHVLDAGCGHGRSLAAIAALARDGLAVGADPSELMVEIARSRNRDLIQAQRVDVVAAGVDRLPFENCGFDKAICVHVIYFWPDLEAGLREIARVLKPGGILAVIARTDADKAAIAAFPSDIYRFRPEMEIRQALSAAGFTFDAVAVESAGREPVLILARRGD